MQRFPLSIFSFESFSSLGRPPRRVLQTLVLTVLLLCVSEVGAHILLRPLGRFPDYWDVKAASKYEYYRMEMDRGLIPAFIVIGDSTAARNIDPAILEHSCGLGHGLNLGWPANYPLAMRCTTFPLLNDGKTPKLVILSLASTGFVDSERTKRFEQSILSSYACREIRGETMISHYIYLARLRRALSFLPSRNSLQSTALQPPPLNGFMPIDLKTGTERKFPEAEKDDMPSDLASERLSVITDMARLAQARRFALVVLVPPLKSVSATMQIIQTKYLNALSQAEKQYRFTVIDCERMEGRDLLTFYDNVHLDQAGAEIFSSFLGRELWRRLDSIGGLSRPAAKIPSDIR
jgi:hypothetical protein